MSLIFVVREKIMTTPRKEMKRDARREEKAERAARVNEVVIYFLRHIGLSTMLWVHTSSNYFLHRISRKSWLNGFVEEFIPYIIFRIRCSTTFLRKENMLVMRKKKWYVLQ